MITGRICPLPFTRCLRLDRQFSPHADKHCLLAIDGHDAKSMTATSDAEFSAPGELTCI